MVCVAVFNSKLFPAPPRSFFYNKVYTVLFGKILCVDLIINKKVMTLLWTSVDSWTYEDTQGAGMFALIFLMFLLRNQSSTFRTIWEVIKLVFVIILVIVTAGMVVKWLKKIF